MSRRKARVLILGQPNFPVPALVRGGAIAAVIDDTLESLPCDPPIKALSLWDDALRHAEYDRRRYVHIRRDRFLFRGIRLLHRHFRFGPETKDLPSRYRDYLIGLMLQIHCFRPDLVVVHTTKLPWVLLIKELAPTTKVVLYHHNSEAHLAEKSILQRVVRVIDAHIFVSHYAQGAFLNVAQELIGPGKCLTTFVIHNGVNVRKFRFNKLQRLSIRAHLEQDEEQVLILFAGRVIERKGLHLILDALELLNSETRSRIALLIVGAEDYAGSERTAYIESLRQRTSETPFKGIVHFMGYVPHEQMGSIYSASDILVFPSIELEGLGLSSLEAQAAGLPVIVSDVGGAAEGVIPGKTGFVIAPGNTNQWAEHIERLVNDRQMRLAMGENAVSHIRRSFPREKMALEFHQVVQELGASQNHFYYK